MEVQENGDIICPSCKSGEMHPTRNGKILIRVWKVQDEEQKWWSQCLVCSGFYDENLNETPDKHDPEKGWF